MKIFDTEICRLMIRNTPAGQTDINTDKIKVLVDKNLYLKAQDIVDDLQISRKSVLNHIRKKGVCQQTRTLGCCWRLGRPNCRVGPGSAIC